MCVDNQNDVSKWRRGSHLECTVWKAEHAVVVCSKAANLRITNRIIFIYFKCVVRSLNVSETGLGAPSKTQATHTTGTFTGRAECDKSISNWERTLEYYFRLQVDCRCIDLDRVVVVWMVAKAMQQVININGWYLWGDSAKCFPHLRKSAVGCWD